jgi:hypothetical protein
MASVLNAFIMTDPYYKEVRDATMNSTNPETDKSAKGIFSRADAGASGMGQKLKPLFEQRYPGVTYDEVAKTMQEPGSMGGLNAMYQGMGPQWYTYYQIIEQKMKKLSEERVPKQKTAGRRKSKKSKKSKRKTRRRV